MRTFLSAAVLAMTAVPAFAVVVGPAPEIGSGMPAIALLAVVFGVLLLIRKKA